MKETAKNVVEYMFGVRDMSVIGSNPLGAGIRGIILAIFVALTGTYRAYAGAVPMPLEARLDMAKDVVVGELIKIEETDAQPVGGGVHWGRATIAVKETLKGISTKTVQCLVVSRVDPIYRGAAQGWRTFRVGDSGIWLIGLYESYGLNSEELISENLKADIQRILKMLADRKWSEPVNGLQAWSVVVHPDYHPNPVIIFAVRNTSKSDIFFPHETTPSFVTVAANIQDGKATNMILYRGEQRERVFCNKLSAGETRYVHPGSSFIDLSWPEQRLPAGKYFVVVGCKNTQEGEAAGAPGQTVPVTAWKGRLEALPVELVLAADETKKKSAQQSSPAVTVKPRH